MKVNFKRKVSIIAVLLVVTIPPIALATTSYAQETYDSTDRDIWVKCPLDMWYIDGVRSH